MEAKGALLDDLEIAAYWDRKLYERLPLPLNHILMGGYFTTPSARMGERGDLGIGGASVPPYRLISGRVQPFSHLEFSANYRIFQGVEDPGLSKHGFGDLADRAGNAKLALILPEDTLYSLPGLAIGCNDFIGTKRFLTYYFVGTQVWIDYGLETSLGWGTGTYTHGPSRGFFGAATWYPFWPTSCWSWLRGMGLAAEYDPTNYKNPHAEPHPDGRVQRIPVNFGVKYNLGKWLDLSVSYIRGDALAVAGSVQYNWGKCTGLFVKSGDPPLYTNPVDKEPLGCVRTEDIMAENLAYALEDQGFRLTKAWISYEGGCTQLYLSLFNECYRKERDVRYRLQYLLAALTPCNIDSVTVILESYGLPCQQYVYSQDLLMRFAAKQIGCFEWDLLTPRMNVDPLPPDAIPIFCERLDLWKGRFSPRYETFLGSAKGKFKFDIGLQSEIWGYLPYDIFYELGVSYTVYSTLNDVTNFDIFNPSQLPNVMSDYVSYRHNRSFSTDKAYIQKSWNLGSAFFAKGSVGYFQVNYAGLAGEILWYPANSYFALGVEGAILRKRRYNGLLFQDTIRHFKGHTPVYHPYTTLQQYFFDIYFDFPDFALAAKASFGHFLASDRGVRLELTRYFESGLRVTGWVTVTDAHENLHNQVYYNKGIAFEIPLDIFYRCSSRRVWNYGMAAWLRDSGTAIWTGVPLFDIINKERRD